MEVTYVSHMGSDNTVCDSARVSFSKLANNYTEEQNGKLIKYLATHGHTSPFFHPQITMREKIPIVLARQRFKSNVGFAYNEVSRRYVDEPPEFFTPKEWRGKPINAKQGSSEEVITTIQRPDFFSGMFGGGLTLNKYRSEDIQTAYERVIRLSEHLYNDMIKAGVAPEMARLVLPQSMMTEYIVTGSLSAWARIYNLRKTPDAQKEWESVIGQWDEIIRPLFPKAWSALVD